MRVALLTNFVPPYRVPLFRALAERVTALRIFVSTEMESNREWPVEWSGLDVVKQRNLMVKREFRHPAGFTQPNYVHVPWDTVAALARFRPDVVISGELGARTLQSVVWGRYIGHRPVLVWATLSERHEQGRGRERLRRWLLAHASGVLTNGESGARYLRRLGVSDGRIFRLPQPIDVTPFEQAPTTRPSADAHSLLYVGALSAAKGLRPLFDALERRAYARPQERLEITLAGTGELREELGERPRPRNLNVHFAGHVPYHTLPELYAAHGILVFPSLDDEWGLVVNEAMASALPVLGSVHAQAVEELVEDGRSGWWFDPEDDASFDAALDRALGTPAPVLDVMREAARQRARQHDPADGARRMLEAINAVT